MLLTPAVPKERLPWRCGHDVMMTRVQAPRPDDGGVAQRRIVLDRRRFLGVAGAGVASALSGCGPQPATSPPGPSDADWQALGAQMGGSLVRPGSAGFDQARLVFNTRFDPIFPQAVARCASPNDVTAVLAFVHRFGLAVTPRSGGH